jgi:hypothetical protein
MEMYDSLKASTEVVINKLEKTFTNKQKQACENQIRFMETPCKNNEIYWNEFIKYKFPLEKQRMSMLQYKSSIFKFVKYINKDLSLVTKDDIDGFVADSDNPNTIQNKIAHIKSILTFIVQSNCANCLDTISKETLILIIQL